MLLFCLFDKTNILLYNMAQFMGLNMEKRNEEVILENLEFIKKNVLKYLGFGVSYDDLVQISCEAVIRAINNYKNTQKFRDYISIYIHFYINEAIVKANCIHFTSTSYYIDIFKILKAKKAGCKTFDEICKYTGLSIERVKECSHFLKKDISPSDCDFVDVESLETEVVHNLDDDNIIYKFFRNTYLTNKEKEILKMRYGFYGKAYTFVEIAEILNISHQRVSMTHMEALLKFRKFLLSIGIVDIEDFSLKESDLKKLKA